MAEQKLREINEAYTCLRSLGEAPRAVAPEAPKVRPLAVVRWLHRALQAVGVAAAILGLIVSATAVHHWITEPPTSVIVMSDSSKGARTDDPNSQPVARRGRGSHTEASSGMISNGTEIIEPRGRRGVGRVTITNRMDRDAVAMLVDSNASDAVMRMVYVSAGKQVALDGIAPGIYRLQLSAGAEWNWRARDFTWRRSAARTVGPLSFTQIQSTGQVRGDQYRVVLRQDSFGPDGEGGEGTLRA